LHDVRKLNKHLAPSSSEAVSKQVQKELGVRIPARTIRELVQNVHVGTTPLRPGNPGRFDLPACKGLCAALASFIEISQVNGEKEVQMNKLIQIVNLVSAAILMRKEQKGQDRNSFAGFFLMSQNLRV
jgi:hypothetical protein